MKFLLLSLLLFWSLTSGLNAQPLSTEAEVPALSEEVIVLEGYQSVASFAELLKPFAGKAVYVDIWATWCGPCRQQFAFKEELMTYAEGKELVYLYISVDKVNKEAQWKNFISQNHISGYHAQAHPELKADLLRLFQAGVKRGRPYLSLPTFVLVNKKGRIVNADARRPSEGKKLYKQLEKVLRD